MIFKRDDEPPTLFLHNINFLRITLHHKIHWHGKQKAPESKYSQWFDEHLSRLGFDTVTGWMVPDVSKDYINVFKGNLTLKTKATQSFRSSGITHPTTYNDIPTDLNPQTPEKIPKFLPEATHILSKQPITYSVLTNRAVERHMLSNPLCLYTR